MGHHRRPQVPDLTQRGSFTVEAALVLPVILVVLLAVVEVIATVGTHLELVAAAREGARVAATVPDPSRAVERVRATLGPDLGTRVTVAVKRPAVVGRPAEVVITYHRPLLTPLLDALAVPLRARAVMRIER